jgi:putative ATPase
MDLFDNSDESLAAKRLPLAARVRPRSLDELVGQEAVVGPGTLLRRAIEADRLSSIILYGPPGCGKTTLAESIAATTQSLFVRTSGVLSNVAELRALIRKAEHEGRQSGRGTILFIDEIHRFSKSQQDVLLPHVEDGTVTLIGATTHNPLFFINGPLVSRSLVFELAPLAPESIATLLRRVLSDERGFPGLVIDADADALTHLGTMADGDARRALNALEIAVLTTPAGDDGRVHVTLDIAEASIQHKMVVYDHDEDGHYDTISAFIKSVRGSDPHAATYWLAKMLYAGEDPRFVARRLVILASEDIGNADPRGLLVATAAMQAVEFVGMPEARITLAQATTYLATAPKSNAAYLAVEKALADVKAGRTLPVPRHLRNVKVRTANPPSDDAAYLYPHDHAGHFVAQAYIPTSVRYYEPTAEGYEETIGRRLARWAAAGMDDPSGAVAGAEGES